jgi:hypothetical protein
MVTEDHFSQGIRQMAEIAYNFGDRLVAIAVSTGFTREDLAPQVPVAQEPDVIILDVPAVDPEAQDPAAPNEPEEVLILDVPTVDPEAQYLPEAPAGLQCTEHARSDISIPFIARNGDKWTFVDATCTIGDWIDAGVFDVDSIMTYEPPKHSKKYELAKQCVEQEGVVEHRAGDIADQRLCVWHRREDSRVYGGLLARPSVHCLKSIRVDGVRMERRLVGRGFRLPIAVRRSKKDPNVQHASERAYFLRNKLFAAIDRKPCRPATWPASGSDSIVVAVADAELHAARVAARVAH